jgi:hypothetical protein
MFHQFFQLPPGFTNVELLKPILHLHFERVGHHGVGVKLDHLGPDGEEVFSKQDLLGFVNDLRGIPYWNHMVQPPGVNSNLFFDMPGLHVKELNSTFFIGHIRFTAGQSPRRSEFRDSFASTAALALEIKGLLKLGTPKVKTHAQLVAWAAEADADPRARSNPQHAWRVSNVNTHARALQLHLTNLNYSL